jgi:predicted NBD/HSP70 family sugar kinase
MGRVDAVRPSLDLLRSLTDEHVLRALMKHRRLTRAELASQTGISKPTVGDSVRRLAEAGFVADTGERTAGGRGRGRVGVYYALAAGAGAALAVSVAPEGIVAECVDAYGDTIWRATEKTSRPARAGQVTHALQAAAVQAQRCTGLVPRLAVVSAAGPVGRASGRLTQLPDEPFLLGDLDPVQVLSPHVGGPVIVDNDVNWAAQAEREHAGNVALNDFAYVFLGEGLGAAIVSDGKVVHGQTGLAGEIAHLITIGPRGQAMRLIEVFSALGLRQTRSTAIDAPRLLAAVASRAPQAAALRHALGQAVSGVLAAAVALTDPELIIIGGSWGSHPLVLQSISAAATRLPRHVPVQAAQLAVEPSLAGARTDALTRLRSDIIATARTASTGHAPPAATPATR